MKVALILPGAVWFAPFVNIYIRILDSLDVDYSIISWNRDGGDGPMEFQYNVKPKNGHSTASVKEYYSYVKFVKGVLKNNKFDKLIVFCPQMVCLLSDILLTKYRGRFMIDYRDLSVEQKSPFKQIYAVMLKFSQLNAISSPGFLRCLPKGKYYISHNFNEEIVRNAISSCNNEAGFFHEKFIDVLTIGGIRDYSSNTQVIDGLANKDGYNIRFVGRGNAAPMLEAYAKEKGVKNITFKGYYQKEEEPDIVNTSTFLNIFYPRIITHDTALSNRFYNSLIFKKPMIVTKNTIQGDYAEKYEVGVAVENCNNLPDVLTAFLRHDYKSYVKRCNELLISFLEDQKEFVDAVKLFISR